MTSLSTVIELARAPFSPRSHPTGSGRDATRREPAEISLEAEVKHEGGRHPRRCVILLEEIMSRESRMLGGILLVLLPTVMYGGLSLLGFLTSNSPGYADNPLRHDLWRAGHAHAGVYLVLSLVMLRYVDEALLRHFGSGSLEPARQSRQF